MTIDLAMTSWMIPKAWAATTHKEQQTNWTS